MLRWAHLMGETRERFAPRPGQGDKTYKKFAVDSALAVADLQADVTALQVTVAAQAATIAAHTATIASHTASIATHTADIATINARLLAAGIP